MGQTLAALREEDLAFLRAGWRGGYILDAARRVAAGEIREDELRALPLAEAKARLMTIRGVGPKVADCTLLYGLGRWDAYPIDVWIKRADAALFTARVKDAAAYLNRRTGGHAGIAQQYIFAWARENL
jgi:N-glycosylase/DNA lyase